MKKIRWGPIWVLLFVGVVECDEPGALKEVVTLLEGASHLFSDQ